MHDTAEGMDQTNSLVPVADVTSGLPPCGLLTITPAKGRYACIGDAASLMGLSRERGPIGHIQDVLGAIGLDPGETGTAVRFANYKGEAATIRLIARHAGDFVFLVEQAEEGAAAVGFEYHSLFNNATYGIYRSSFDGRQLRANPALVHLNGYDTEAEMLAAVHDIAQEWYVKPERRAEFFNELQANGKVVDFVSEIYRHKTRERIWVSETAWLVLDAGGRPKYVEGTLIDATERIRALDKIRHSAEIDSLCGIPNRGKFLKVLGEVIAACGADDSVTVMLLDLDRFKDINDVYGHARGDEILVAAASRIRNYLPGAHLVARLGGDEFAAIITSTLGESDALQLGDRLAKAFAQAIPIADADHTVGASVGVAQYPLHASTSTDLVRNADMALHQSKTHGRGRASVYDVEFDRIRQARQDIEVALRGADVRGELELFYQPIVESRTGKIVGLEALMRWRRPGKGLISPAEFIPIAEEAGLMNTFGAWAIDEACRHAASLPPDIHVAVNVSAVQFHSSDLPRIVETALRKHGIEPRRIELEVTETVVLKNEAATILVLNRLQELGVGISLDDFGTGYSSLSYLQRFAFDKVKIDQSFIRRIKADPVNSAVVRAVLSIGRDLGIPVVAEGIETDSEKAALLDEGCELFQGYLYGRPQPFADAASSIAIDRLGGSAPELPFEDRRVAAG